MTRRFFRHIWDRMDEVPMPGTAGGAVAAARIPRS